MSYLVPAPHQVVIPSLTAWTGVAERLVGSVYLPVRKIPIIRAYLGEETAAHDASLRLRRDTGGAELTTLTSGALPANVQVVDVTVANADWYHLYLLTDDAAGVCICTGVRFE